MELKQTTSVDKQQIHNDILRVALKLFADKGYFGTSLTDIAVNANINVQEIYQHFPDKQAIAKTVYNTILDSLSVSIDDIRRRYRKSSEQLHGIVDLLFRLAEESPDVLHFLLMLRIKEFLPEEKPFLETPAINKIIRIIQAGIQSGEIRNISALMAYSHFFGIINHTLRLILGGSFDKKNDIYHAQAWHAAWNTIAKK